MHLQGASVCAHVLTQDVLVSIFKQVALHALVEVIATDS